MTHPTVKRIKMIVPVPAPKQALQAFAAQIPPHLLRPDIAVEFVGTRAGAATLDSHYEMTLADAFVLDAGARAEEEGFAAVCVNSMSDSGLAALRSRLTIPVVGSCQSAILTACLLGKKFSVVTMWDRWKPLYEKVAAEYGLSHRMASILSIDTRPDTAELLAGKEDIVFDKLERAARLAIERDGADVILLGSTTMHQSHAFLAERLPVPVINPGVVAFKLCEMLLDTGLTHSKYAYAAPESAQDTLFNPIAPIFP